MVKARSCVWLLAIGAFLFFAGLPAAGQILPQEIKSNQGELSAEQKQQIAEFVDPLMKGLITGNPTDVAKARTTLVREFDTPNASENFKDAFSDQITTHMDDALSSDQVLVRINAMIITTELTNDAAEGLINRGLQDENPAVQYWGAKAYRDRILRTVGENGASRLSNEEQRQVLSKIKTMITPDAAVPVVQSSFEILAVLSVPEAQETLLKVLNDRVSEHANNPQLSYRAEQAAIARLSNKLINNQRNTDQAATQALLAASYRYFTLINQQLKEENKVLQENRAGHKAMMGQAHQTLAGVSARQPNVQLPQGYNEVKDWINFGNWAELTDIAQRWKPVLQAPPFSIEADKLAVQG